MLKILHAHLLRAFVANLKINAIYALYPESFCNKNLTARNPYHTILVVASSKLYEFVDGLNLLQIRPENDKISGQ